MSEIRSHDDLTRMNRRGFLRNSLIALGGVITVGVGTPVVSYFISPALKESESDWVAVAAVSEIPKGKPVAVEYSVRAKDGWTMNESRKACWVVTEDGEEFTAFDPRCTHLGCAYHWDETKNRFLCPCHNGVFDKEGKVVSGPPPKPLERFETRVTDGKLFIRKSSNGA